MKYLLDTNVLSDARARRSPEVMDWVAAQRVNDLAVSAVSVLELERGILRKERKDPEAGRVLRQWLHDDVLSLFHGRILDVDTRVAVRAAALHVPDPMPEFDALIAATALVHGLVLVTRNLKDLERAGATIFNPQQMM